MAAPLGNRHPKEKVFSVFFGIDETAHCGTHLDHDYNMDLKPRGKLFWSLPRQNTPIQATTVACTNADCVCL